MSFVISLGLWLSLPFFLTLLHRRSKGGQAWLAPLLHIGMAIFLTLIVMFWFRGVVPVIAEDQAISLQQGYAFMALRNSLRAAAILYLLLAPAALLIARHGPWRRPGLSVFLFWSLHLGFGVLVSANVAFVRAELGLSTHVPVLWPDPVRMLSLGIIAATLLVTLLAMLASLWRLWRRREPRDHPPLP